MITYKLNKGFDGNPTGSVNRYDSESPLVLSIPFVPDNADYQNFKKEINADQAQLEDVDGNLMTAEQAKAYVATLP